MIMIVGMIVFPIPREAAIVQSIKDEKQYENAMILIRCMPAALPPVGMPTAVAAMPW